MYANVHLMTPGICRCTLIFLLSTGVQGFTHDIPPMPPAPESLLVGDMLRIDATRARAAELAKVPISTSRVADPADVPEPSGASPTFDALTSPTIALTAIYGVGAQLYADVLIQGHTVTYVAGRAQAIRATASRPTYRLRAIQPPCVQLDGPGAGTNSTGTALKLCLGDRP